MTITDFFGPLSQQLELESGKALAEIHGNPVSAVCMFRPFKASERSRQLLALQRLTDLTNLVTLHNVGFKINLHNVNFLNETLIMTSNNSSSISTWAL